MESWEKLTNPTILKNNLINASVFISAYEMCREFIVSKPRGFFTDNWGIDGEIISDDYHDDVMSFNKSPLKASLLWFEAQGAINSDDIDRVDQARMHRNEIAHRMPLFISDPEYDVNEVVLTELIAVTHKIGIYWILNFELNINPEYANQEIDENNIQVGTVMMIDMLKRIAFEQEPEPGYFYNELKRRFKNTNV